MSAPQDALNSPITNGLSSWYVAASTCWNNQFNANAVELGRNISKGIQTKRDLYQEWGILEKFSFPRVSMHLIKVERSIGFPTSSNQARIFVVID